MWSKENLDKVTETLRSKGSDEWWKLVAELGVSRGSSPEGIPWHDKTRNKVVVENPYSTIIELVHSLEEEVKSHNVHGPIKLHNECPIYGPLIELDEKVAMKLLVLGMP